MWGSSLRSRSTALVALAFTLLCPLALFVIDMPSAAGTAPASVEFHFRHENILGTSLDLIVQAPSPAEAENCEEAVLDEIERLRRILSTYDPESEISRLQRERGPLACSPELIEVLRAYDHWQARSGGAFNGQLGGLLGAWKKAARTGIEPDSLELKHLAAEVNRPAWRIEGNRVTLLTSQPLNVNAIGKGYILKKAAAAGRSRVSTVQGLILNIGGDIHTWGCEGRAWLIGVADPAHPQDNAPPLTRVRMSSAAVATSAGYERPFVVAGKRYSHILDPRTGRPVENIQSATVVARDNVTANALATSLCVLPPEEGLKLIQATPGAECLLVLAGGRQVRSPGLGRLEVPIAVALREAKAGGWPAGYQVNLTLTLLKPVRARKVRRPYVAIWFSDEKGNPVRTVTVWGNQRKYQKDLSSWWRFARDDRVLQRAVTRATRAAGRYQIVWDGLDDKGKPVPQGTYTVTVEVNREHGRHIRQVGKIECGAGKAQIMLEKSAETDTTLVQYAPGGK
jgi:FAD:protein FMN transferase